MIEWTIALTCAFIIGLSKGGVKGIAVVIVVGMVYVYGGRASTGIVVPLLIAGDIFAVIYYHRHAQWAYLIRFLPWMIIGVLLGVWFGNDLPEDIFKQGMAGIILFSAITMYVFDRMKIQKVPSHWSFSGSMGLMAGFTTMVGNLAGGFTDLFFLAMRLPKNQFIGTGAWLFLIINVFKVPFHVFVWKTITVESLMIGLYLLPAVLLGLFVGVKLVAVIKEAHYRKLIIFLTAAGSLLIFFR
ncbi:MAG: sulfite exporter TauE/SafE family protein [Bacteroidetes bacterium]|nr:sulfite exporter TauE/SafE family protein [Bacteroidota bacterium]MDA1119362.1 sulfite exporter TauE/SafE family protein [Bacteroidota bacterium]